jgi:hypothetical protein
MIMEHAASIRFDNVRLRWERSAGLWRHALDLRRCDHIDCRGLMIDPPAGCGFAEPLRTTDS